MRELTLEEMKSTDGGEPLTAAGVACGFLGFGVGFVVALAVVGVAYYCLR